MRLPRQAALGGVGGGEGYQNQIFSKSSAAPTTHASGSGRSYHLRCSSFGSSVSPYTRPRSSDSGRGLVITLTAIVTRKQVTHAKMAIQKFCAIVDGKLWSSPIQPPFPSATVSPCVSAAAAVPESNPRN